MDELLYQWTDMLSAEIVPGKREVLMRFFKTAPGEYGEGDQFLGITVPSVRKVSKLMTEAPLEAISRMLKSEIHEHRLSALLVLVERYRRAKKNHGLKKQIADFYLSNTRSINNWDLVDLSAPKIIGNYVYETGDYVSVSFNEPYCRYYGIQLKKDGTPLKRQDPTRAIFPQNIKSK
nr:DNA alkylation repair protein [uncultured Muribaculum sp.]